MWDTVKRKIVRSRYFVFFDDQNVEDIQIGKTLARPKEEPINLDPIPHLIT